MEDTNWSLPAYERELEHQELIWAVILLIKISQSVVEILLEVSRMPMYLKGSAPIGN